MNMFNSPKWSFSVANDSEKLPFGQNFFKIKQKYDHTDAVHCTQCSVH